MSKGAMQGLNEARLAVDKKKLEDVAPKDNPERLWCCFAALLTLNWKR